MKWQFVIPLIFLSLLSLEGKASPHGVKIQHQITKAIKINAVYDSGNPLSNASVTVYAPNFPNKPWLQGMTDEEGNFIFAPDHYQPGSWEIKVRQAGHGNLVSVPFQVDKLENYPRKNISKSSYYLASTTRDYNPIQRGLMIGCVIWGFVGTSLFFWRFPTQEQPQENR
ncbi:MAG: carboxypeptidase-like regulatory domain-containing protein [Trichodesmium sp. St16_bin4-tuft]|nr:carboxypeptidase-like regulatory domain-containing protein [Trichodesmium sp. St4_bin8_1]MDE5072700.1 carboxypeptidase-like regulatory domain-containing protein [Trichodesmium sp. St5_bin8]MDE5091721.1 carboxypeptidase-like regulatory domain-containing protein [Trichodesmium sp. St18_bin3_1_1]MDE5099077.1 carboxypeptidase-like regulatory domain-containing protein [Trichodesmium sp. St16_bin4-tuft]MDE5102997.1 carboxypeptidase-like regulatory domain-containing protein [Trichodesmium sp. St19_